LLRTLVERPDRQLAISARARLAHALIAAGDLDSAASEASAALEEGGRFPSTRPTALGALSLVALHRGQLADAVALADRASTPGPAGAGCATARSSASHAPKRFTRWADATTRTRPFASLASGFCVSQRRSMTRSCANPT